MQRSLPSWLVGAAAAAYSLCSPVSAEAQVTSCPELTTRNKSGVLTPASQWEAYRAPDAAESASAHGALTGCYHVAAGDVKAATGLVNAGDAILTRHVTQDNASKRSIGSAAFFTTALNGGRDRPVVVYYPGTSGLAAECGAAGLLLTNKGGGLVNIIDGYLKEGYNVLMPEYLGHGIHGQAPHPYAEGRSNAQASLDAILAARALPAPYARMFKTNGTAAPLGLHGYSEGGQVLAWASQILSSYAPALKPQVLRAGGIPVDEEATIRYVATAFENFGIDSGYMPMAIAGMLNATDPATRMTPDELSPYVANAADVNKWVNMATTKCRADIRDADLLSGMKNASFDALDFISHPKAKLFMVRNSLTGTVTSRVFPGQTAASTGEETLRAPSMPFMFFGSNSDLLVDPKPLNTLVHSWPGVPVYDSSMVLGWINVPNANQVWVRTTGVHGTDDQDLYRTNIADLRYTPYEWFADRMR
jgi:Secretory lipase